MIIDTTDGEYVQVIVVLPVPKNGTERHMFDFTLDTIAEAEWSYEREINEEPTELG